MSDEKPTPPVAPDGFNRIDADHVERKRLEIDRMDVSCPKCGNPLYWEERQTGRLVLAFWDSFDDEKYQTTDEWPEVQHLEICRRCPYRREI